MERLTHRSKLALIAAIGNLVMASAAQADDLAADCCAIEGVAGDAPGSATEKPASDDLDNRVQELEEAASAKGDPKISVTVSGQAGMQVVAPSSGGR